MDRLPRLAILGLGEAGNAFASALTRSATVRGFDPFAKPTAPALELAPTALEAVAGADAVLAFTPASSCREALEGVLPNLPSGTIYADFATTSPDEKRSLDGIAAGAGVRFVDGAIMAPVRLGAWQVPVLLSGAAASELASQLRGAGLLVEAIEGPAGTSAGRKLLRSILVKGLTCVMIESLRAAEAEGMLEWFSGHLLDTLTALRPVTLAGLLDGTLRHSDRRALEMEAAASMAEAHGTPAPISRAAAEILSSVESRGIPARFVSDASSETNWS